MASQDQLLIMTKSTNSTGTASENISSLYASSLASTHQEPHQDEHARFASKGRRSSSMTHDAARRSKRDECLDYLVDVEAVLRGQMTQLQSLSSHALRIEEILQDAQSPLALAARALDGSLVNMQHILRGNIALIDRVKPTWPEETTPPGTSSAAPHEMAPPPPPFLHSETSSLISFSSDESDAPSHDPCCESTDRGDMSSPSEGPVKTPPALENPLQLHYHADVADIQDFMIHAPLLATTPHLQSRRIILSNLPPAITPAQVLHGLPPHGILQRITMLTTPPLCGKDTHSALLEFVHPESAATCLQAVLSRPPFHPTIPGRTLRATARLIPTPSYPFSSHELSLFYQGWSRTLLVRNVPRAATWFFLCEMVGLKNLVAVRVPARHDGLVLEFAAIHEAARVGRLLARATFAFAHWRMPLLSFVVVADSSPITGYNREINYIPPDFLERQWNRPPFNTYFPSGDPPSPKQQPSSHHHNPDPKPTQEANLCSWAQYGLLAKQRRNGAGAGRGDAADIKRAPVPAVVREYLDTSTFQIINTTS